MIFPWGKIKRYGGKSKSTGKIKRFRAKSKSIKAKSNCIKDSVYIDEGITGTQAKKRPAFLRMIEDAKEGKFDLIVTREVCRFARNTVDTLVATRELKNIGVEVYFVEDNIWTMDGDGELRLTIMATLAQEESRKVSERVKAGQHISRNNGVIYGNGNILGYDLVEGKYVINEEQAETVRMIFDMYLNEGIGATKIANELCRRKRVAASGQVKWTASNVSRILRNSTYMGYMAYGKSFSNNYLEQKRVNNHNSDTYMYVRADFEPIITEDEWRRCETIRKSRRVEAATPVKRKTPFGEESVTVPRQESHDKWNRKLRCACGSRFRKNRWHKNKYKEWTYGYECYNRINNGSAKKRRDQGLDDTGYCEMPMVSDWKLEVMCKMLLEKIWQDKSRVIQEACSILQKCYQEDTGKGAELFTIQKKIAKTEEKISNLIDLRTEGDISIEEYRSRRKKLNEELSCYKRQLQEQNKEEKTPPETGLNWGKINETLKNVLDFSKPKVDNDIVERFIARIIPMGSNHFVWVVNLSNLRTEEIDMVVEGRKTNPAIYIGTDDSEDNEDDESSLHTDKLCLTDLAASPQEKKYSLAEMQHRRRLHRSEQFLLKRGIMKRLEFMGL